jgi:hypothetical protein
MNPGLCASCVHVRIITSDRGSTFLRCGLSDRNPRFPKYPRLPVLVCTGWIPTAAPDRVK